MTNEKLHIRLYYGKQVFWQRQPRVSGSSSVLLVLSDQMESFWHMVRGCKTTAWFSGGWQQVTFLHHSSIIPHSSHVDLAGDRRCHSWIHQWTKASPASPNLGKEKKTMICRALAAVSPNRPRVKSAFGEESLLFTMNCDVCDSLYWDRVCGDMVYGEK